MKKNLIYIVLAILAIVVAIVAVNKRSSTWNTTQTDFAIEDTGSVYRIFLSDKNGHSSDLQKDEDGSWTVNSVFPARTDGIEFLMESMMKMTVLRPVPRSAHNSVVGRLASIATKVEIYANAPLFSLFGRGFLYRDKLVKVYYVGDATQDNRGTYMLLEGSDTPFIMYVPGFRGFLYTRFTPKEEDWRQHGIFSYRIPEIAELSISFPDDTLNSFTLTNNGDLSFTLRQAVTGRVMESYDTIKVLDLLVSFADVRFENFLEDMPKTVVDSICSTRPLHVISIRDQEGGTNTVYTFRRSMAPETETLDGRAIQYDLDRMYALINGGKDFVLIQYFVFDRLLQPMSFYLGTAPPGDGAPKSP